MRTTTSTTSLPSSRSKPKKRARLWLKRVSFGLVIVAAGLASLRSVYQLIATRLDAQRNPLPGEMVDAGGYWLHLLIAGATNPAPTVILNASLGMPSTFLVNLVDQVAPFAGAV